MRSFCSKNKKSNQSKEKRKTKRTIFEHKQTVARIYKCFPFPLFFLFYSFHFVWTEKNQILHFDHTPSTHTQTKIEDNNDWFPKFFFHISLLFIIFFFIVFVAFSIIILDIDTGQRKKKNTVQKTLNGENEKMEKKEKTFTNNFDLYHLSIHWWIDRCTYNINQS